MNVRKTDDFIADIEQQYDWYVANADWDVADYYLDSVQATCQLLGMQPGLGPLAGFAHARLRDGRFFLVFRPFRKHVLFYEIRSGEVVKRRAMHGHRDLPGRLLETSKWD
ncbi:MAG: type II toxin-antitoxin system RelE/ParE family toxin [Verrucomicrobiota bacterium]|jgi:plasmid stabilization system protein ParE